MLDFNKLFNNFRIQGNIIDCTPFGGGHINDTYLVEVENGAGFSRFILQRINHGVFTNVERLMQNQELVTAYIENKLKERREYNKSLLRKIIYTADNKSYILFEDNYYRLYEFIEEGECLEKTCEPLYFELSGIAFGRFQKLLDGFDASLIFDSIPDFHNTPERFNQLKRAINFDAANRCKDSKEVIDKYLQRIDYCDKVVKALETGALPTRVTHNDTKLNNVLIDTVNKVPLAVIDLDTVMAGSIVYDFGDSIRYGANTGDEDEKDLSKVNFDINLYKAFAKGFLSETKDILTECERESLAFGALLITYETGMRFLADHLNGDKYFKVKRENHNLDRAKTQLKMVEDMEKAFSLMNAIIKELCYKNLRKIL